MQEIKVHNNMIRALEYNNNHNDWHYMFEKKSCRVFIEPLYRERLYNILIELGYEAEGGVNSSNPKLRCFICDYENKEVKWCSGTPKECKTCPGTSTCYNKTIIHYP